MDGAGWGVDAQAMPTEHSLCWAEELAADAAELLLKDQKTDLLPTALAAAGLVVVVVVVSVSGWEPSKEKKEKEKDEPFQEAFVPVLRGMGSAH